MSKPPEGREPWWTTRGRRAVSVVRLDGRCLGLRVRLASEERVTMPLGPMTFKIR